MFQRSMIFQYTYTCLCNITDLRIISIVESAPGAIQQSNKTIPGNTSHKSRFNQKHEKTSLCFSSAVPLNISYVRTKKNASKISAHIFLVVQFLRKLITRNFWNISFLSEHVISLEFLFLTIQLLSCMLIPYIMSRICFTDTKYSFLSIFISAFIG